MRPWLIFGAGGSGVGALTAERALAEKRPVIALVRNPQAAERLHDKGATVIVGDACDPVAVANACNVAGKEALAVSTLGGEHDYLANRTIIDTAEQAGITRMILVTSLGCGDSWIWLSPRARAAFGQSVREKSLAESWLQTSSLDFAILRPSGLLNTPATGRQYVFSIRSVMDLSPEPTWPHISRRWRPILRRGKSTAWSILN